MTRLARLFQAIFLAVLLAAAMVVWKTRVGTCYRIEDFGPFVRQAQIECPMVYP